MSRFSCSRVLAAAVLAVAGTAMLAVSFDAEARRAGGGGSVGRQSTNVMQQRQAVTPPAAATGQNAARQAVPNTAAAAGGAAASTAARSGASRWFGPIAGIAAGLGIAALLSSMGLSGAVAEFLSSMLLIALLAFAVLFIIRRLRGGAARSALQGAGASSSSSGGNAPMWRESASPLQPAPAPAVEPAPVEPVRAVSAMEAPVPATDNSNWFIPGDFDTPQFLNKAKQYFVQIQAVWDSGEADKLREFLTDDLIAEMRPQLEQRQGVKQTTEVVLLNAELLGIENVSDGYLASVRFSGMLREEAGAEAFRFEEVWNLFKPEQGGWLLAGIQQIPVEYAS